MGNFIEAGKITSLHSFRGEVKIYSWCDSAEFLTRFKKFYLDDEGKTCLKVNKMRIAGDTLTVSFEGIESEESAAKLKNKVIYADKKEAGLEDGVFFVDDLIGLPVKDFNGGKVYGVMADVFNNGATDIYVITPNVPEKLDEPDEKKAKKNREVLIPNVSEFVKKVSLDEGVFITPVEGMF